MSKHNIKQKISSAIKLIDLMTVKLRTLTTYFLTVTGSILEPKDLYADIVGISNDVMFNEDRLYILIEELMTDYIRELTGKDIDKIIKKYTQYLSLVNSFYSTIKFKPNESIDESFKIKLPKGIDKRMFKQNIYDMTQKTEKTFKLMKDFKKLVSIKGHGVEQEPTYGGRADIPRKYM